MHITEYNTITNIDNKPKNKPHLTKYRKFMSDTEIRLLLRFTNEECSPPISMAFHLLIGMGLRVGEVINIKTSNIIGNKLIFKLEKCDRTHERIIPDYLFEMLTDYIKKYKKAFTNDYIITNKIGGNRFGAFIYKKKFKSEHITYKTMQYQIKIFRNKYNLNDSYYTTKNNNKLHRVTLHTIRHNFLYRLYYTTKKDLLLTADIIGHQNIKVTSEYIRGFKRIKEEENVINTMAVI